MKKKLVSIMLVAAMALSAVACGSSKGNSAKTDGTEAMASSVSKTPDNQISINLASEPQSIDPALNSAVDGGCMIVNSFAGLYTYDKDGKLIPQLASDMPEVSDDETVYTVKMIKSQWSNGPGGKKLSDVASVECAVFTLFARSGPITFAITSPIRKQVPFCRYTMEFLPPIY